ncbi:MAG TPA: hypothetical protein VMD09_08780 [Solirubrobacteraceae bacterium]|nr:hypothetical protein [Solirubrobacteraceae bacterium]
MDHDQKTCPRCGEPTASYGFCPPCRAHIDALTGGETRAPDLSTAHVLREVVRLEEALADASKGIGSGTSTAAVGVDSGPEELAEEAAPTGLEIAKLPAADDAPQRPDVARLEDVLTVRPRPEYHAVAPRTAAAAPAEVEAPSEEETSAPDLPPAAEVLPVEQAEADIRAKLPLANPSYVAAHVLRAAFWFEQTSAFESRPDHEVAPDPIEAAAPVLDPARHAATSVPPPSSAPMSVSAPPPPPAEPLPTSEVEPPTSQRNWITALCLLALIALVVVLTGRRPCRCDCHKSR